MQQKPVIRTVTPSDLDIVTQIEAECFPQAEAAPRSSFADRIKLFPSHFFLLEADGVAAGFINGMVTSQPTISDTMFADASLHEEAGDWQSVFGLDVLPAFRHRGFAAKLMEHLIAHARQEGRRGVILTCKEHMIGYYQRFGFVDNGISASTHGGAVWHDMTLRF
jgi:ribosomal protein S18 acetylase RimI-like enzyme